MAESEQGSAARRVPRIAESGPDPGDLVLGSPPGGLDCGNDAIVAAKSRTIDPSCFIAAGLRSAFSPVADRDAATIALGSCYRVILALRTSGPDGAFTEASFSPVTNKSKLL